MWVQVQSGFAQGMWMYLRIPEEAGFWRGDHEREVQKAIVELTGRGDVIYDVGAHLGSLSLGAARLVGPAGKVVAFDPEPGNIERLRMHVARNNLQASIQIVPAALWSGTANEIPFRRGTIGTSQGGVEIGGHRPVLANGEIIHVPAITLDAFVAAGNATPHLLKIDVEGGECEVLRGGENLFRTHRPFVMVEVHHQEGYEWLCGWLEKMRYAAEWKIPKEAFPRYLIALPQKH